MSEPSTTPRNWSRVRVASILLLPALIAVAFVSIVGAREDSPTSDPNSDDSAVTPGPVPEAALVDSDVDRDELDRMIRVLSARAVERNESLEYQTLGSLYLERAQLDASVPDYRSAVDAFASAMRLAPDRTESILGHGQASLGIHDFASAAADAAQLIELDPRDRDSVALTADAATAVGAYDEAAAATDALVELDPEDPAALVRLAQVELRRSGPTEAREVARRSVELAAAQNGPAGLAFYLAFAGNLANTYGDLVEAESLLEAAVEASPEDHGALGELARIRAANGATEEAIELLEKANSLIPEPDHLVLQADLKTIIGDDDGAAADYEAAVREATLTPDHERAWARALAGYLLDSGVDVERGREIAVAELDARKDAGAYGLMAWAEYRSGDLRAAQSNIDDALATGIPEPTLLYHAAVIAESLDDDDRAVQLLETALDINPAFDPVLAYEARAMLAELR